MFSRRKFLSKAALLSIASSLGFTACNPAEKEAEEKDDKYGSKNNPNSKAILPAVIATWENIPGTAEAMKTLNNGGRALDAVENGVKIVEADPDNITVGYGGLPDRDGFVTLDACIMDEKGNAGSVSFLQNIKHPISVARKVMEETPHVMLTGAGALQFALEQGFLAEDLMTEKSKKAWQKWLVEEKYEPVVNIERHDTIGMLAVDEKGNLSGACTTSGMAFKMHGRVGDSPIIGAGLYVDNEVGGACATGVGELVLKTLGSFLVVELMYQGRTPQEACEEAVHRIADRYDKYVGGDYQVGFVALSKTGEHGAYSILSGFNYTLHQDGKNQLFEGGYVKEQKKEE